MTLDHELEQLGFKVLDKADRRLEGIGCLPELQKEKFFLPLEYKGYIFLFVLESDKYLNNFIDVINTAAPFISRTRSLDEEYIEKKGYDIGNSCHDVTRQMVDEIGKGQKLTLNISDKSLLSVRHMHSLIRLQLDDQSYMTIDPTQPFRGQHDPRNPETYKLRECTISPLIMVGSEGFIGKKFSQIYKPETNPFAQPKFARVRSFFSGNP